MARLGDGAFYFGQQAGIREGAGGPPRVSADRMGKPVERVVHSRSTVRGETLRLKRRKKVAMSPFTSTLGRHLGLSAQ